ncbi:MAG: hypothetical protein ABUS57_19700 [Pseudomonadota bacterium]
MKLLLCAVLSFGCAIALDIASAQVVTAPGVGAAGSIGGAGAAGIGAGAGRSPVSTMSGPTLGGSGISTPGTSSVFGHTAPPAALPPQIPVQLGGSGGGPRCRRKTSSECAAEAGVCLVKNGLSGPTGTQKYIVGAEGGPHIAPGFNPYTTPAEDTGAAACGGDLSNCLTGGQVCG